MFLLQQRLHQGAANEGVAVSVDSVGEPRARHADLLAVLPLDHSVVSVAPFFLLLGKSQSYEALRPSDSNRSSVVVLMRTVRALLPLSRR
tara:strand:- start:204 stop:473 length:270 start_codon:yes stop_codon:yes gene_type:complete